MMYFQTGSSVLSRESVIPVLGYTSRYFGINLSILFDIMTL